MFNLENLNDDFFKTLDAGDDVEIKKLKTEDKIKCFKFFLSSDVITNHSIISNLYILVNGISDIDEDIENDDRAFFNSLEEYVDIKLDLKEELDLFKKKIVEYYLGIIKGLIVKIPELKVHITNTHYHIFHLANPEFISKMMLEQLDNIDVKSIKPTFNAESLYDKINDHTYSYTYGIFQRIMSEFSEEDI